MLHWKITVTHDTKASVNILLWSNRGQNHLGLSLCCSSKHSVSRVFYDNVYRVAVVEVLLQPCPTLPTTAFSTVWEMTDTFCIAFILYGRFKPVVVMIISIKNLLPYSWKRHLEHRLKSMDLLKHHWILHQISRKVRLRHISYFARKLDALNKHNFYAFLERCTSSSNFFWSLRFSDAFHKFCKSRFSPIIQF